MDFKVFAAGTDQTIWRPNCSHGAGSGQWHKRDECHLTDDELRQAELRAAGAMSEDRVVPQTPRIVPAELSLAE